MYTVNRTYLAKNEEEYKSYLQNFLIFQNYKKFVVENKERLSIETSLVGPKNPLIPEEMPAIIGGLSHIIKNSKFSKNFCDPINTNHLFADKTPIFILKKLVLSGIAVKERLN